MRNSLWCHLTVAFAVILFIAGCATADSRSERNVETCRSNCAVTIELPADSGRAPTAPAVTRIAGGQVLDFNIDGQTRTDARTVLAFEQAAFLDQRGKPLYTLELAAGSNRFESRPYEDGVCHGPGGCRYVVINVGNPTRPPIINSPVVIIDPR